jgi:hypothetical protein
MTQKQEVFWNGAWFSKFANESDEHAKARLSASLKNKDSQFTRRSDERGWRK